MMVEDLSGEQVMLEVSGKMSKEHPEYPKEPTGERNVT